MNIRIKLLNIETNTIGFFVIIGELVRVNASGWAYVACSWYKRSQAKSKLPQNKTLAVKLLQNQSPDVIVEVKNIGSTGFPVSPNRQL